MNNANFIKSSVTKNDTQKLLDDVNGEDEKKQIKLLHDIINQMHTIQHTHMYIQKCNFLFNRQKNRI